MTRADLRDPRPADAAFSRGAMADDAETIRIVPATRLAAPAPVTPPIEAAPKPCPPAVLSVIEQELARFVGPLARTLVQRSAQRHATVEALVLALLPSIESAQDRESFSRSCARRGVMRKEEATPAPALTPTPTPMSVPAPHAVRLPAPARRQQDRQPGSALLRAADSLLEALPRLRSAVGHAPPAALQAQLLEHLSAFAADATARGVLPAHITAARRLLCSFVDEVIASTAWGSQGQWARHSLLRALDNGHHAGHDPFDLLPGLIKDPITHAPLIELYYVCIALGFEGRLRNTPHAHAQLDALAVRLRELLPRQRANAATAQALSPRWQGQASHRRHAVAVLPLWVVTSVGGVLLLALWFALNARLDALARPVHSSIAALPAALQGTAARAAARPRLASALQADAAAATIEVRDEAQRSLVTLPADTLFVDGSARLTPQANDLLSRVAQALRGVMGAQGAGGEVAVIGHGDDEAPNSLQYPSNWHFTRARAQAVADALITLRVAPARAEGRAEFEPRAPNTTPAGRALNRRIDIELRLLRPDEATP